jgi:hypothetical protein
MPRYRITFDDGSSIDQTAASPTAAKLAAKREAQAKSGATSRTDPRVKVAEVTDLDQEASARSAREDREARTREESPTPAQREGRPLPDGDTRAGERKEKK